MKLLGLKELSLIALVLQNTLLVLLMRYSRTRAGPMYFASVAVAADEGMKLIVCTFMLMLPYLTVKEKPQSLSGLLLFVRNQVFPCFGDFARMGVPALCYTVQKHLLYVAVSNLDAAVFQVAYQGKIISTAVFAYLILGKRISLVQVFSLLLLLTGVSIVQLSSLTIQVASGENVSLGLCAVVAACCTSGFASIYFEWTLKKSVSSLWVRNFQLTFFACILAAVGVTNDFDAAMSRGGLFQGFDWVTWLVVAIQAFGGIVVAIVVKYADNILKNFATAVSILTSTAVSFFFFNFELKEQFVFGSVLVLTAIALYTSPFAQPSPSGVVKFVKIKGGLSEETSEEFDTVRNRIAAT